MEETMSTPKGSPFEPKHAGCWFDGARGIYIGEAVIDEARGNGWDATKAGYTASDLRCIPTKLDATGEPDYEDHHYDDATDAAERYLDGLAPTGYWIGFNDGDFGMYAIEEDGTE